MENTLTKQKIEDELSVSGVVATNTVGVSMKPLFKTHRDAVVLKKPDRALGKYDVVLYKNSTGRYVLHRVIGEKNGVFIIRGDNTFEREYVPKEDILAYMISFNRRGKHHTVGEVGYKLYSRVWNFIYPVRFFAHKVLSLLRKTKKALFGRKKQR